MTKKFLITDIDWTIYRTDERAYRSALDIGLTVTREQAERLDPKNPEFIGLNFDRYYDVFDSPEYARTDQPIEYAVAALRELRKYLGIAYVSTRPEGSNRKMRQATLDCFKRDGFPVPGEDSDVFMLLRPPSIEGKRGRKMKKPMVYCLTCLFDVVAGVGDMPGDSDAYLENTVPALIIKNGLGLKDEEYPKGTIFLPNWKQVEIYLKSQILRL